MCLDVNREAKMHLNSPRNEQQKTLKSMSCSVVERFMFCLHLSAMVVTWAMTSPSRRWNALGSGMDRIPRSDRPELNSVLRHGGTLKGRVVFFELFFCELSAWSCCQYEIICWNNMSSFRHSKQGLSSTEKSRRQKVASCTLAMDCWISVEVFWTFQIILS